MKSTEISFQFPVLGFTLDLEIWGFPDLERLTKCGPITLRENMQAGMELIEADGRRWRVRSVTRTGRAGSWLSLLSPFGPAQSRIEQDLEPLEPAPLAEVQRRACLAMETFSINYLEGDDRSVEFDPMLAKLRRTRKISEIYDLLNPDTFEPY
ncbi:hypothetical protein [Phenylobacterium aquaticum]|uniref:hypothetical protein n=1 Tax=Phenylobacterium aquaticum TaxID=1763816 RepID=UPI0026F065D7|nr:hypothetical protein [Phenylobacterium aquaticum]